MDNIFEVTFLGTNGSCAYNNGKRTKYGSNTLSVALKAGENTIIFDAGTGICKLRELPQYYNNKKHLFLTHYHMDHIDGLLFFNSMFDPDIDITIYGSGDVQSTLHQLISPPLCPVGTEVFSASLDYKTISLGQQITLPGDVVVKTCNLSHPGGALGCRVEYSGKSFCYCVDVELSNHDSDNALKEFFKDVDLLVLDASFADGTVIPGWGHSSPAECTTWAKEANVGQLALYHYNYTMTDEEIVRMEEGAKKLFPNTFAAYDGMSINLV